MSTSESTVPSETPLWDTDHPYYATEGSFFQIGWHTNFASWADFIHEQGRNDLDLNLLYRWDWETPDASDLRPNEEPTGETVALFFIHQRKAATRSVRVSVTRDDEPAVRAYLVERADRMRKVWEPLLPGPIAEAAR